VYHTAAVANIGRTGRGDRKAARADAMPAAERVKRVAELQEQLLELERREEALIMRAHSDGLEILRRSDANPLAVLNCVIVKAQVQQVA
jgi:hypothetical protein